MDFSVILTSPSLALSGVNVFSANLIQGLLKNNIPAHFLVTDPDRKEPIPLPISSEIPVKYLPVDRYNSLNERWKALIDYLEKQAPCIYIPNYDFRHSCISPRLSNRVAIVGIVHSDETCHYEHVARLGNYWNAIVTVSQVVAKKTTALNPEWSEKLFNIPIGVPIPDSFKERFVDAKSPLKIVYAGRLTQYQKRIFDLPKIVGLLRDFKIPIQVTIVGDGSEKGDLFNLFEPCVEQDIVRFTGILSNQETAEILEQNDAIILTSEFEGLPNVLLEAMGRGCIPVVTDIPSGISELVRDGLNGYLVPVGDVQTFAERLAILQQDLVKRREMSLNAYAIVRNSKYTVQSMVESYIGLFNHLMCELESGNYNRPPGKIIPRPDLQPDRGWRSLIPTPIKRVYHHVKADWFTIDSTKISNLNC
jgi:glycosyltransferase involved in cell wall biosynthesis